MITWWLVLITALGLLLYYGVQRLQGYDHVAATVGTGFATVFALIGILLFSLLWG